MPTDFDIKDEFKTIYGTKFVMIPSEYTYNSFKNPKDEFYLDSDGTVKHGSLEESRITLVKTPPRTAGVFRMKRAS